MTGGRVGFVARCTTITLLASALFASVVRAQEPLDAALVTKAQALGGKTRAVAFDGDGSHALSAGGNGDLLWWDCATHSVLRSWPPFARYASAIAVHPSGDWALVAVEREDESHGLLRVDTGTGEAVALSTSWTWPRAFSPDGRVFAIAGAQRLRVFDTDAVRAASDLASLEPVFVWGGFVQHACFDPAGRSVYLTMGEHRALRCPLDGAQPTMLDRAVLAVDPAGNEVAAGLGRFGAGGWSVSPDGAVVAGIEDDGRWTRGLVRRRRSSEQVWSSRDHHDRHVMSVFASPTGEVWAMAGSGLVHVYGPGADDHVLVRPHEGPAFGLVFSPDGRYLALLANGGLRIVDSEGATVLERAGQHAVWPGATGSEFGIATPEAIEAWHAATGRTVGERVVFRGGRLELNPAHGQLALVPQGSGWVFARGVVDGKPAACGRVASDGAVTCLPVEVRGYAYISAFAVAASGPDMPTVLVWGAPVSGLVSPGYGASFLSLGDGGEPVVRRVVERTANIQLGPVRSRPGGERIGGLVRGSLVEWDARTLETVRKVPFAPRLEWFEYVDGDSICGGDATGAWILDLESGERTELTLPVEPAALSTTAISADRRQLALAFESGVVWLRLP